MNRLVERLSRIGDGVRPLAPYLTAGDGGSAVTLAALQALDEAGVCCVELGLPFSDPIADGAVIQRASERALAAGMNLRGALAIVAELRRTSALPIVLMSYVNPLLRHGLDATVGALAEAGIDGLLVPDLPIEEGEPLASLARAAGLCPIFFVAPTSDDARIARTAALCDGFVYAIGRFGVTGGTTSFDTPTRDFLDRVRRGTNGLPVGVGFGIRDAEQVARVVQHADFAITGSAYVERLHAAVSAAGPDPANAARAAADATLAFVHELTGGPRP